LASASSSSSLSIKKTSLFQGNKYHGRRWTNMPKAATQGTFGTLSDPLHSIFLLADLISVSIAFPYRSMRQLY
jgi:hypothetical protein